MQTCPLLHSPGRCTMRDMNGWGTQTRSAIPLLHAPFYFLFLCFGAVWEAPLNPQLRGTTFILQKFKIFAKLTSRYCSPRLLPPPCRRGDARCSLNPWVLGAAFQDSKQLMSQSQKEVCSNAQALFFFFFPKFILSVLQYSFLLPSTAAINK